MKIDAYSVLIVLSILVVLSYIYNYLSKILKIPSVLLLIASGLGLQYASVSFGLKIPPTQTLLEILGVTGLIFIVLEAALDLKIEKSKYPLIWKSFLSALILLALSATLIAFVFTSYYGTDFRLAMIHAIPLSVISSAIAIPSVINMDPEKREFIIYESTFSDILGIIAFNYMIADHTSGFASVMTFTWDLTLIMIISIISTGALIFLLNHTTSQVRFFLTFAIIILTYSLSKSLHLPSLILVLCFGLVINNFRLFNFPIVRRFISFDKLNDIAREMKLMTAETAFIIRTFFFLLFGYSMNISLLKSEEVILMGLAIIVLTLVMRLIFLRYLLKTSSAPLALIAPRGLITILLFYSIPTGMRIGKLSEGVLFVVIVLTSLAMTLGLLINKKPTDELPPNGT
jgi:Kef-type K+ transport system membrane component KefB